MRFKLLYGAAVLLCASAVAYIPALAQSYGVAKAATVGAADLFADIPLGIAGVQPSYVTAAQIAGVPGYTKAVATTGFSYTFGNSQTNLLLEPVGTLATGTVTFASNPSDGQTACIFSTQTQTALTLSGNTGQTVSNAVTALTALTRYCWVYSVSNATWDRSQ
jgi:hypothetical protein